MVVNSVSRPVVITFHSKDVSVLAKEIHHSSGQSVTQVWPGCCSHVLQLRGSVVDLLLFIIGWGCQCDWFPVFQRGRGESFHELLVISSIQSPHWYHLAVSDNGPGYVESFGRVGLWTKFYQVIFHSERALQSSHHHSLKLCWYHVITGHYQAGRKGFHPSSSARCSI
jgi:hypothetical protein